MKEELNRVTHSSTPTNTANSKKISLMVTTAIFATLITIMTAYVCHIPVPVTGGYIHVGDSLIYLVASILPMSYAMLAGAIGGGMADLLTAPMWVLPTVVIKALITLPFSRRSKKIVTKRNILATIIAYIISLSGYYFANTVIFGADIAFVTSFVGSTIQSLGSGILYIVIGLTLDKINFKARFCSMEDMNIWQK